MESLYLILPCHPLLSFEGHPGQKQTELGLRVYPFTTQAAVLLRSDAGSDVVIEFCHSKSSEPLHHVVLNVWGTILGHGLHFGGTLLGHGLHFGEVTRPHLCRDE